MSDSGTDRNESDRRESDSEGNDDGSSKAKSALADRTSTSANEPLRRSTRQKNPVVQFGYEYIAHHYAYMTHVVEVREPEITQQLRRMGFATSKSVSSLFIHKGRLGPVSILLYVDDLVIIGVDLGEIDRVKF